MKSAVLLALAAMNMIASSASASEVKTCLGACDKKSDFAYRSYRPTGLGDHVDIKVTLKEVSPGVEVELWAEGGGMTSQLKSPYLINDNDGTQLILVRYLNYKLEKKTEELYEKMNLRLVLKKDGKEVASHRIPFASENLNDQVMRDDGTVFITLGNSRAGEGGSTVSAKVGLKIIAAGGMKCTWVALEGAIFCDPALKP